MRYYLIVRLDSPKTNTTFNIAVIKLSSDRKNPVSGTLLPPCVVQEVPHNWRQTIKNPYKKGLY